MVHPTVIIVRFSPTSRSFSQCLTNDFEEVSQLYHLAHPSYEGLYSNNICFRCELLSRLVEQTGP